jgi:hypothetical protein
LSAGAFAQLLAPNGPAAPKPAVSGGILARHAPAQDEQRAAQLAAHAPAALFEIFADDGAPAAAAAARPAAVAAAFDVFCDDDRASASLAPPLQPSLATRADGRLALSPLRPAAAGSGSPLVPSPQETGGIGGGLDGSVNAAGALAFAIFGDGAPAAVAPPPQLPAGFAILADDTDREDTVEMRPRAQPAVAPPPQLPTGFAIFADDDDDDDAVAVADAEAGAEAGDVDVLSGALQPAAAARQPRPTAPLMSAALSARFDKLQAVRAAPTPRVGFAACICLAPAARSAVSGTTHACPLRPLCPSRARGLELRLVYALTIALRLPLACAPVRHVTRAACVTGRVEPGDEHGALATRQDGEHRCVAPS